MNIDKQVNQIVQQVVADITDKIQAQVMDAVSSHIADAVSKIDYQAMFKSALTGTVASNKFQFPDRKSTRLNSSH